VTWQPGPAVSVFAAGLFADAVAVVTGGGSGLGREAAHGLARLGAHVVIAGRTGGRLDEVATSIQRAGGSCLAVPTNIREPAQVGALRDAVYDRYGRVDFLVNNAGGQFPGLPSTISDNGWRAVVDLNLNGTWNVTSRFMGPMAEAGSGSIVNVVHTFSLERGAPMLTNWVNFFPEEAT
jgi:NAD(P)-dependent dehydrogenase (short-subunit alcohol dehydrogenase family)